MQLGEYIMKHHANNQREFAKILMKHPLMGGTQKMISLSTMICQYINHPDRMPRIQFILAVDDVTGGSVNTLDWIMRKHPEYARKKAVA